nr:amidase [Curtobacterium pusillum]
MQAARGGIGSGTVFELHHLAAQELWDWIRRGEVTALEVTDHYLDRIARLDPDLGAFVTVTAEAARDRADHLGHRVPTSRPLWGLPSGDKDLYDRAGVPTRNGTTSLPDRAAAADHPLVAALDAAGAVSLGKTASPEFGMSSSSETRFGTTRNPYDPTRAPGGSSSGAAVAVAAGLLPAAVGSDGGGSVRIPAAATGLVGLKPSRGRVPSMPGRSGVGGLSVAGPLTRNVADAGMLLDALVAPTGLPEPHPYALVTPEVGDGPFTAAAVRGEGRFVVGLLDGSPWDDTVDVVVDPAARAAVETALRVLGEVGHGVEEVAMPRAPYADAFRVAWESSAARLPMVPGIDLSALTPLVAWLVARGRRLTGTQVLDAMTALDTFSAELIGAFDRFDAVLTPTLALTPRPLGWYGDDPEEDFRRQCAYSPWTSMANVAGLPAITLPVGVTGGDHPDGGGLPMGVQLIGRPGGERVLLAIGAQLERRLRWQRRHPSRW